MIYLASRKPTKHDEYTSHEFYYDGALYFHSFGVISNPYMMYGKFILGINSSSYEKCDSFEYELPETLNIIEYTWFRERVTMLFDIVEQKIFDNI